MAKDRKKKSLDITFEHEGRTIKISPPTIKHSQDAQAIYNEAFFRAITSKAMLRVKLEDFMREQGVWNADKQVELLRLHGEILSREKRLAAGGFRKSEAREVAIEIRILRNELRDLNGVRSELDGHTAEGQAENERFNYLVSVCVVYNDTGEPCFKSLQDYMQRNGEEISISAAQKLAFMTYGLDEDFETKLPENVFLKEFNFVNDDLKFVNEDGHLVSLGGELVDEDGSLIAYNKDGEAYSVDIEGTKLDDTGNYDSTERKAFLDDDDKPLKVRKKRTKKTVEETPS